MAETVLYFGYGANRDARMMAGITGRPADQLKGRPAVLEGYSLAVQRYDQLPDVVLPTAPYSASPRQIIHNGWGEQFESYVIKADPHGKVSGTLWELTPLERERVRDWELLDFGWYHDIEGRVKLADGTEIDMVTEAIDDSQEVDREVNGMDYETWLQDPEKFDAIAANARAEFDERMKTDPEGKPKSNPEMG